MPSASAKRPATRPARRLLQVAVALALAPGCAATDSTTHETSPAPAAPPASDPRIGVVTTSHGVDIVHDDWARLGYRWQWSASPITAGNPVIVLIDVLGDTVAVQSTDSWTALLQAATGATLWQVRNTGPLTEFVDTIGVNDVVISCGRPELFLMEAGSGNLIARQPVEVVVSTPPVVFGGLAVFGTPTGQVLCHRFGTPTGDPLPPPFDDGAKEWGYLLEGAITAAPVRLGSTAGLVTQSGEVFFVDIPTGRGMGRSRISGGLSTDPVTDGRNMYVASLDQSVYAFGPESTTYLWRYRTDAPLRTQPAWHDGVLYVHADSEGLLAFDVSEDAQNSGRLGERLWASPEASGHVVGVRAGDLLVWNGREAFRVDRASGDVIAVATLPAFTHLIASQAEDGDLYAVSENGHVVKFGPR